MKTRKAKPVISFTNKGTVKVPRLSYFTVENTEWLYLRDLVNKIHSPFKWYEFLAATFLGVGLTLFGFTVPDRDFDSPVFFGGIFCIALMIIILLFVKRESQVENGTKQSAVEYMDHIEKKGKGTRV